MRKIRISRLLLGSGVATVSFFALMQFPASANFLNQLTQGFADRVSREATNLTGSALERVIGKSFKDLRNEVLSDLFGDHPSEVIAKASEGALGLPDIPKIGKDIEEQIQSRISEATGINDGNDALAAEAQKRQAVRVVAAAQAAVNTSDAAQQLDLTQLEAAQSTGESATQMARQGQSLTVTQDVMKLTNQIAAGNTNLLAAILANQHRSNQLQTLGLSQLTQIARAAEIDANRDNASISAETNRLIHDSAAANSFFLEDPTE